MSPARPGLGGLYARCARGAGPHFEVRSGKNPHFGAMCMRCGVTAIHDAQKGWLRAAPFSFDHVQFKMAGVAGTQDEPCGIFSDRM
jgi:hypothetical protein